MVLNHINKQIIATVTSLIAVILISQFTNLDILIEDYFYQNHSWILDRNNKILKFILYSGMKELIILFFALIMVSLLFFYKKPFIKNRRKELIIILLSGILIPSIVGGLKFATNMPCPKNLSYYDADYPNVSLFEHYPKYFKQKNRIRCWPAGHASGGFALMSITLLFKTRRNKIISLIFSATLAWSIATYKMLIGDHFISHTIVTMIIAWLIILLLCKLIKPDHTNKFELSK